MPHSTFNKSGVPRSRNARSQLQLDTIYAKNEKKWCAELKERRRMEENGYTQEKVDTQPKSRRF